MKNAVFLLSLGLLAVPLLRAQSGTGKQHAVAVGVQIPVGVFSESHLAGIGTSYSWSRHRLGRLPALPQKTIGFVATGGVDYYLGRKITEVGYDFKYFNYLYIHAFGGMIYNPGRKINTTLSGGPTLGVYKGSTDIGYGIKLDGSYSVSERIALSPGVMYMKHALANTLWVVMVKGTYNF